MRRGEGNPKDSGNDKKYTMQGEKRKKKMREWRSWKAFHKQLQRQGFKGDCPILSMTRWRNSNCFHIDFTLPNKWFAEMKLFDLTSIKTGVLFNYVE